MKELGLKEMELAEKKIQQLRVEGLKDVMNRFEIFGKLMKEERKRLLEKYGSKDHPRVLKITTQMEYQEALLPILKKEVEESEKEFKGKEDNGADWKTAKEV